jgi:DHA3 family macrolide efflux protein-like MFS transporter
MRLSQLKPLRDFLLIWAGQCVSAVGSRVASFALGIWVLRTTGSTTEFAMTFVAMTVPALMVSTVSGALVDRWDRRRIMIACDALSALTMLLIAGLGAGGHLTIWFIYLALGAASLFDAFRTPAFAASIPQLAPRELLPRVNGMVQTGNAVAEIVGPLVAGALVSTISLSGIVTLDAVTFLAGVGTLAVALIPQPAAAGREDHEGLLSEAAMGWRYVSARPGLVGLLAISSWNNLLFSIACVVITPLVLSFADPTRLGVQYAISGVGLLLGGVAMVAWGGPRKRIHAVLVFSCVAGACLAAHGARPSLPLIAAAGFVLFLTIPVIAASGSSLWQSKVPPPLQGRCFAIQRILFSVATIVGYCVAGPLSENVFEPWLRRGGLLAGSAGAIVGVGAGRGTGLMFVAMGALMTVFALVAWCVPAIRNIDEMADTSPLSGKATSQKKSVPAEEELFQLAREARL